MHPEHLPNPIVQFLVPKSVARALGELPIRGYESCDARTRLTMARVTCRASKAAELIEAVTALAESSRGQLAVDCATAAKNGLDALAPKPEKPADPRSDTERGVIGT